MASLEDRTGLLVAGSRADADPRLNGFGSGICSTSLSAYAPPWPLGKIRFPPPQASLPGDFSSHYTAALLVLCI